MNPGARGDARAPGGEAVGATAAAGLLREARAVAGDHELPRLALRVLQAEGAAGAGADDRALYWGLLAWELLRLARRDLRGAAFSSKSDKRVRLRDAGNYCGRLARLAAAALAECERAAEEGGDP